jgi:hypothetical protein
MDKNHDPGSGINIPDPQHCWLTYNDSSQQFTGSSKILVLFSRSHFTRCSVPIWFFFSHSLHFLLDQRKAASRDVCAVFNYTTFLTSYSCTRWCDIFDYEAATILRPFAEALLFYYQSSFVIVRKPRYYFQI